MGKNRNKSTKNSRLDRSENFEMYAVFKTPKTTRLYSHVEYTADSTMLAVEKIKIAPFL